MSWAHRASQSSLPGADGGDNGVFSTGTDDFSFMETHLSRGFCWNSYQWPSSLARGGIPHHQGAIDMARVVLQFEANEQTKKWASEIIAAQEREIAEMREWLVRNSR
jgi:hypothetical protein